MEEFELYAEVLKASDELGLVFGWALISKVDGQPYVDKQGDNVSEAELLKASTQFMIDYRVADEMHDWAKKGMIVHSFPLTTDIAAAFGIQSKRSGWMIAMKPDAEMYEKFRDGAYKGFSIGGFANREAVTV